MMTAHCLCCSSVIKETQCTNMSNTHIHVQGLWAPILLCRPIRERDIQHMKKKGHSVMSAININDYRINDNDNDNDNDPKIVRGCGLDFLTFQLSIVRG